MKQSLRRLAAALTMATAAATGGLLLEDIAAPADTTWGAPSTATPDISGPATEASPDITPLDTTWG